MRIYLTAFTFAIITLPIASVASTEETWFCTWETQIGVAVSGKRVIVEELTEGYVGYERMSGLKGKFSINKDGVVQFQTKYSTNKIDVFDLYQGHPVTSFSGTNNMGGFVQNYAFVEHDNSGILRITSDVSRVNLSTDIWFCDKF